MEQRHKPAVKRGRKEYTYHVESRTTAGRYYVVDAYRLTCSCPAGRKERGCWHLRLCLGYHDWRKAQQEQARREAASWGSAPAPRTEGGMQALAEAFA